MITLQYSLTENDYLQYLLYNTSRSKRTKQKRRNSWIILTIAFFLVALICYDKDNHILAINFALLGLVTLFFYPMYVRKQYIKLLNQHVWDNYQALIGEEASVKISDTLIEIADRNSETKCRFSAFSYFTETKEYFYLQMLTNSAVIIPKSEIENVEEFKKMLRRLSDQHRIEYKEELSWEWK